MKSAIDEDGPLEADATAESDPRKAARRHRALDLSSFGAAEVVTPGEEMSYVPVATVRRFDPDTGISVEVSPLPAPRTGAVAVRLADGRVLVAGGTEHGRLPTYVDAPPVPNAFIYAAADDIWTETARRCRSPTVPRRPCAWRTGVSS